jgi:glutathione S-transferase
MELYFAPLACSLATRISLYEVGARASATRFTQVDTRAKRLAGGGDFFAVNPMGQVPVLRTDAGELLTENSAVLQYVADRFPEAKLAPEGDLARARLREWLGFIGTELHKAVFVPLLDPKAPGAVKAYAREKLALRMDVLAKHLSGREFLLDAFSVADAYLATVLNWTRATDVSLAQWPAVQSYHERLLARPSVAKALGEEFALYQAGLAAAQART